MVAGRSYTTHHHEKIFMEMGKDITEDISGDKNDASDKSMYLSDILISNNIS